MGSENYYVGTLVAVSWLQAFLDHIKERADNDLMKVERCLSPKNSVKYLQLHRLCDSEKGVDS